jgi:hypothetical protein
MIETSWLRAQEGIERIWICRRSVSIDLSSSSSVGHESLCPRADWLTQVTQFSPGTGVVEAALIVALVHCKLVRTHCVLG